MGREVLACQRSCLPLCAPILYYAWHTGRWGREVLACQHNCWPLCKLHVRQLMAALIITYLKMTRTQAAGPGGRGLVPDPP